MMTKVRAVYTGELSGCFPQDLGFEVKRGVPFECDEKWLAERLKYEPERWKKYTAGDAAKGAAEAKGTGE